MRRCFADNSAAAAVEFAIVVVPFLAFVALIFQMALYHFALQSLGNCSGGWLHAV